MSELQLSLNIMIHLLSREPLSAPSSVPPDCTLSWVLPIVDFLLRLNLCSSNSAPPLFTYFVRLRPAHTLQLCTLNLFFSSTMHIYNGRPWAWLNSPFAPPIVHAPSFKRQLHNYMHKLLLFFQLHSTPTS